MEILYRNAKLDRKAVNVKDRTVELSFSSESPVDRFREREVLSHQEGDYDFSRLNSGGAVLLDHDADKLIGVIQPGSARVDGGAKMGAGNHPFWEGATRGRSVPGRARRRPHKLQRRVLPHGGCGPRGRGRRGSDCQVSLAGV
jgi:hypothetical protein